MAIIAKPFPDKTYRKVIESAFFGLSGIFVGIMLNDVWRLFDLPGNRQRSEYIDINQDELYQYMIAAAITLSSLVIPIEARNSNNLLLGLGTAIGVRVSNATEIGRKIELVGELIPGHKPEPGELSPAP